MKALRFFLLTAACSLAVSTASAWDYEGHRLVNQVALASLPTNFPAFVRTPAAQERVAFLAGEPDRWRNTTELPFKHASGPDHFLDMDELPDYGLSATNLSPFRYEFAAQLAVARAQHPTNFAAIDPAKNEDRTRTLIGFLPWAMTENYAKLRSEFSYLKAFQAEGTPEEVANAQQNIITLMGTMGHYVGDAGQPLHTTKHFNGWVGENPKGYSTAKTIHSWIDGGYIRKVGIGLDEMKKRIRPAAVLKEAQNASPEKGLFPKAIGFLIEQSHLVETVYELNKSGALSDNGEADSKGRAFITGQILKSGQLLGDMWLSAYETAPVDTFLQGKLVERKLQAGGQPKAKKSARKDKKP